ncbi:MAG: NCS2 family permease [Prevotella sp.]|nr:NCS2 family permease [Prevotella sp.]
MKEKLLSLVGFSLQRNNFRVEVVSGLTTFVTMSYILALNPTLFAPLADKGYPIGTLFTATALAATIGCLLMAFLAKRPMGQAPGLALNIFFVQTVCVSLGYSWRFALTAVLIEGLLFILLCLSSMRQIINELMPASLKYALAAGIGFFIASIGFKNSGILADGTIFNHIDTLTNPESLLFIVGLLLSGCLIVMRVRGGLLFSIIAVTLLGIPLGITAMPERLFSVPASPAPLFCQFSWSELLTPDLWVCVLTMLFFDVFDTLGSVVGLMANSGLIRKNGRIPNMRNIMLSDALGTVSGACLGCSTVTTYVESAAGVVEGGRTGLTAFVIALCFLGSLFLSPLFLSIPAAATAPVMVIAGFCLFGSIRHIDLTKPVETLPAFLTILLMPVSGSITDGIIGGLFTYVAFSFISSGVSKLRRSSSQTDHLS